MSCFPKSLERQLAGGPLTLSCTGCGFRQILTNDQALDRLGREATPVSAAAKTRCAKCGLFRVQFS